MIPKRERTRLAKADLRVLMAVKLQQWADDLRFAGTPGGLIPFDQWDADDPFVWLAIEHELSAVDLAKLLVALADEAEARAERVITGGR
jgi:hypothetical protein